MKEEIKPNIEVVQHKRVKEGAYKSEYSKLRMLYIRGRGLSWSNRYSVELSGKEISEHQAVEGYGRKLRTDSRWSSGRFAI